MEPPGGGRHRWENRQVEWAGARESRREPNEFHSRKGISEIEGKAAREAASEGGSRTSFKPLSGHILGSYLPDSKYLRDLRVLRGEMEDCFGEAAKTGTRAACAPPNP
jgi:hypothetical protein